MAERAPLITVPEVGMGVKLKDMEGGEKLEKGSNHTDGQGMLSPQDYRKFPIHEETGDSSFDFVQGIFRVIIVHD
jgi:hypothetical protein